ncbi:uncharacterized protein RJT21DRAFT_111874 [Scheffersomyces amazonensis]|uniref:uncharacterized protein n=1 Tax=Scheffersomyces amazonensis TaxID=1078765 RepID=UPI00315D0133
MSDLAFNNYCLTCDKLCSQNSIYCSEECKSIDEYNAVNIISQHQQGQEVQTMKNHHRNISQSTIASDNLVSPLLTPSLYQHSSNSYLDINSSPLLLTNSAKVQPSKDLDYFDLNYSVNSKTNYTLSSSNSDIMSTVPSTSHNYRKWLTACL